MVQPLRFVPVVLILLIGSSSPALAQVVYMAPQEELSYGPSGSGPYPLSILIRDDSEVLLVTQGFSMGMAHDGSVAQVDDIEYGDAMLDPSWGQPDFFQTDAFENGWTVGVVYAFLGSWTYTFPEPEEAIIVTYSSREGADFLSGAEGAYTDLTWTDTLGTPPVSNVIVAGGASIAPDLEHGYLEFVPRRFVRGDMNGDGAIDLADIFVAQDYAFLGLSTPSCLVALDANADGGVDIADIIFVLSYLFIDGVAPPAPFPDCGTDPAEVSLGCEVSGCAP